MTEDSTLKNWNELEYLDLLEDILEHGVPSDDRTGVGTLRVPIRQCRFNLRDSFPLMTTKNVPWKGITSELLWFIEGSGDERRLAELRYGKDRSELNGKNTIWTENADAPYWKPKAKFEGDLGRVYGMQWRDWSSPVTEHVSVGKLIGGEVTRSQIAVKKVDQLAVLIEGLKKDPNGRRHILSAWNPGELDQMALPPCHVLSQYTVINNELYCHLFIRSWDVFLGGPFNIASYSLLTMMIAQVCGFTAAELVISVTDAHIYKNHVEQVNEQLSRDPRPAPQVLLNPKVTSLFDFTMDDITLKDYDPAEAIKAPMAV